MNAGDVVSYSRIRLARNKVGVPFPSKNPSDRRLYSVLAHAERAASGLFDFDVYAMSKLPTIQRQALVERRLISASLAKNVQSGALLLERGDNVSVMINEEDHVRAQCILEGLRLFDAYAVMDGFDSRLEREMPVAFSPKLGYLTACPTNVGTGMRASVMVFVPALASSGAIDGLINELARKDYAVRGAYGEGSKAVGATYQISNRLSLGLSEQDILSGVESSALFIARCEQEERERLYYSRRRELEDTVLGLANDLTDVVSITADELTEAVATCKLGVALGFLPAVSFKALDKLVEEAQPASLCLWAKAELAASERDLVRANFVREYVRRLFVLA